MYKPLPEMVTIKDSGIHGLGLFATDDISSGTILGMIHFEFHGETMRTPLGAFGNHSDDPTVIRMVSDVLPKLKFGDFFKFLYTIFSLLFYYKPFKKVIVIEVVNENLSDII